MNVNRNQFFLIGLVLLVLGLQFRAVEAYVLNEECSKVLHGDSEFDGPTGFLSPMIDAAPPIPQRTIELPRWLGWSILSIGGVFILHSLAMRKPE